MFLSLKSCGRCLSSIVLLVDAFGKKPLYSSSLPFGVCCLGAIWRAYLSILSIRSTPGVQGFGGDWVNLGYPDSCMDIFAANFSVVSGARGKVIWRAAVPIAWWSDLLERNKRILMILRSMSLNVGVAI